MQFFQPSIAQIDYMKQLGNMSLNHLAAGTRTSGYYNPMSAD
jgi:hypothetical protein